MATFVLVHGSWHDGSSWREAIARLQHHGHTAFAPTVAGHGKGVCKQVTHAQSTQSVVDFIVDHGLTDLVLVGHSYGGTIISKVVEAIPQRVRRLVFWSAFVLNDGESLIDAVPPYYRALFLRLATASDDNTVMLPFSIWRESFINDADLEVARRTYEQLSPEPYQQMVQPLDLGKFYRLKTPRSYLVGTDDIALPPGEWVGIPGCPRGSGSVGSSKCRAATSSSLQTRMDWWTASLKLAALDSDRRWCWAAARLRGSGPCAGALGRARAGAAGLRQRRGRRLARSAAAARAGRGDRVRPRLAREPARDTSGGARRRRPAFSCSRRSRPRRAPCQRRVSGGWRRTGERDPRRGLTPTGPRRSRWAGADG